MTTSVLNLEESLLPIHKPQLLPIQEIAAKIGLLAEQYEPIGRHGTKLNLDLLTDPAFPVHGKFILVRAVQRSRSKGQRTAPWDRRVKTIGMTVKLPSRFAV